ncbi:MAG: hypothetical protein H0Z35_10855 [Thermoanaerobacteraceae bacterium]|nr:hypothetical protein [Thermoanaerobacteraceae bacterium]
MAKLSRREFLKQIGLGTAGITLFSTPAAASSDTQAPLKVKAETKISRLKETYTVCAFCGCGCGIILYSDGKEIVYAEGDPDHPVNQGTLCTKGSSIADVYNVVSDSGKRVINPRRIIKPLYRAPGSSSWEEKSWDWILKRIAQKIKETRDATFEEKDQNGVTVNRTQAIAALGSASLDNEENYLLHKMFRGLGIINMEHHARL